MKITIYYLLNCQISISGGRNDIYISASFIMYLLCPGIMNLCILSNLRFYNKPTYFSIAIFENSNNFRKKETSLAFWHFFLLILRAVQISAPIYMTISRKQVKITLSQRKRDFLPIHSLMFNRFIKSSIPK